MSILTFGATIQKLLVHGPHGPRDVVLGFDTCEEYLAGGSYMGCVVGRFANRIAAGRFTLDGTTHQLSRNEGDNHLHGGAQGFSRKVWSIQSVAESSVDLSLVSPAGEEGYPGTLTVQCRYSIEDDRHLRIALSAITDAPTIVNLATHSYFNLDGEGDILRHRLAIPADAYLPTDAAGSPTGEFAPVKGTPFDFRTMREVRPPHTLPQRYDNTYVLAPSDGGLRKAARLESSGADIGMEVWSTEPGIQLFDAGTFRPAPAAMAAPTGRTAGCVSSRSAFPIHPINPASPTARFIPARRTGRSPNIGSMSAFR